MSNLRPINRNTYYLLPASFEERGLQRPLAGFVLNVVDKPYLSAMVSSYRASDSSTSIRRAQFDRLDASGDFV